MPRLQWLKPFVMYAWHLRRSSLKWHDDCLQDSTCKWCLVSRLVLRWQAPRWWYWYSKAPPYWMIDLGGLQTSGHLEPTFVERNLQGTWIPTLVLKCWIPCFRRHEENDMKWLEALKFPDDLVVFLALTIRPPDWRSTSDDGRTTKRESSQIGSSNGLGRWHWQLGN